MKRVEVITLEQRRLDAQSASAVRSAFSQALSHTPDIIVLDMQHVEYVNSMGISVILSERRRCPSIVKIVLAGLFDDVREIFEVTRMFDIFEVYETAPVAQQACAV